MISRHPPPVRLPRGVGDFTKGGRKEGRMDFLPLILLPLGLCALAGGMFLPPLLRHPARD